MIKRKQQKKHKKNNQNENCVIHSTLFPSIIYMNAACLRLPSDRPSKLFMFVALCFRCEL